MSEVRVLLGPPGTGKTTRLIAEVEKLLAAGVAPYEIAFVSFTNAACDEARDRACEKFHLEPEELPHFRTTHSMGLRTPRRPDKPDVMKARHWKMFSDESGCDFSDEEEAADSGIFRTSIRGVGDALRAVWQRSIVSMCPVDDAMIEMRRSIARARVTADEVRRFGAQYVAFKQSHNLIDYEDMLDHSRRSGARVPGVRFAFVDEAQDNNALQNVLCRQWFSDCERVTYAGDDDQAIFTFAGARPEYLQSLAETYASEVLSQSWRVPKSAYAVAIEIVSRIQRRAEKAYRPRDESGTILYVRDALEAMQSTEGSVFVLARNKQFLEEFAGACESRAMHYEMTRGCGSLSPLQHKDTLGGYRALCAMLGKSGASAEAFHSLLTLVPQRSEQEVDGEGKPTPMRLRGALAAAKRNREPVNFWQLPGPYFAGAWWASMLADRTPFERALKGLEEGERQYLQRVYDRFGAALPAQPEARLMTEHRSKGREADTVIVCPDMLWPSFDELHAGDADSEHRLAYVAATRCRKRLIFVSPREADRGRAPMFYPFPRMRRGGVS